jgi:hypothetical protein
MVMDHVHPISVHLGVNVSMDMVVNIAISPYVLHLVATRMNIATSRLVNVNVYRVGLLVVDAMVIIHVDAKSINVEMVHLH